MPKSKPRKQPRRQRRPDRRPASTEASAKLVGVLTEAGLPGLARRASTLEFDENYSSPGDPLNQLVQQLLIADRQDLVDRVIAGEFDATAADNKAFYATPRGRREAAEADRMLAEMPPETRRQFEEAMTRLGKNPAAQQRMMEQHVGQLNMNLGLMPPAPDDDDVVPVDDVVPQLRYLLGQRGPAGERLDTPEILAAAELGGRCGGAEFTMVRVDADGDGESDSWVAAVVVAGVPMLGDAAPGPSGAAAALARALIEGAQCQRCGGFIALDARPRPVQDKVLADGRPWSAAEQAAAPRCLWRRERHHWRGGCEQR